MIQKQFYSKQNRQDVGYTEIQSASCPFDPTHLCLPEKLYTHIMRCKSPNRRFYVKCKYSELHYIYPEQKKKHEASCPNKDRFLEDYHSGQDWDEQEQRIKQAKYKKSKQNLSIVSQYSNVLPQQSISQMKSIIAEDSMMHKINVIQNQLNKKNSSQPEKSIKKINKNQNGKVKQQNIIQSSIEQSSQMDQDSYSGYDGNQDYYGDDEYNSNQSSSFYSSVNKISQNLIQQPKNNNKNTLQLKSQNQNVIDPKFFSLDHFSNAPNKNKQTSQIPTQIQLCPYYCYYFFNQFDGQYYDINGILCQILNISSQFVLKINEQYYPMANVEPTPNPNYFIDDNTNQIMMVVAILISKNSYEVNFLGNASNQNPLMHQEPAKKNKKKKGVNQLSKEEDTSQKRQYEQTNDLLDQVKKFINESKQQQKKQRIVPQRQKNNVIKKKQNKKHQSFYQQSSSYSQLQAIYDQSISLQQKQKESNFSQSRMSSFVQDDLKYYGDRPNFNKYKVSEVQIKLHEKRKKQMEQYQGKMKQKREEKLFLQKLNELSIIQKKQEESQNFTMQKFSILNDF